MLRRLSETADLLKHATFLRQGKQPADLVVAKNINAIEGGFRIGAIDEPSGGGCAVFPRPGEDGRNKMLSLAAIPVGIRLEPLVDIPAVVFSFADDVDLFVQDPARRRRPIGLGSLGQS